MKNTGGARGINWAQMEGGNTKSEAKTLGEERTVRESRGSRESDRARAGQGEDVMKRREKEGKERTGGERVSERT